MDNPAVPAPEQVLLKWIAPSRPYKTRDRQFFATMIVIAILISILLAFAREWMLIAVIAAMIFAYYVWSTVAPEEVEYSITTRGIRAYGQLYRWEGLTQWWVEDKWGQKILVIAAPTAVARRLHLLLGQTSEEQVTRVLEKYLVMERPPETALDRAGKWVSEKFPLEAGR